MLKNIAIVALSASLATLPFEIWLRFNWDNKYITMPASGYHRTWQEQDEIYEIGGLFESEFSTVRIHTDRHCIAREGRYSTMPVRQMFVGGSTTESALVQSFLRFPVLVDNASLTCALSGNNLLDSQQNISFLFANREDLDFVERIYLMHGINDLASFFRNMEPEVISDVKTLIEYHHRKRAKGDRTLFVRVKDAFKNIYVVAYAYEQYVKWRWPPLTGTRIREVARQVAEENRRLPVLGDIEFDAILDSADFLAFLSNRSATFRQIASFTEDRNIALVMLTQPHAYELKPHEYDEDFRTNFQIAGKRTSLEQSAKLMRLINIHTREIAAAANLQVIDVDHCLRRQRVRPNQFYDSVHYTEAGSKAVAACIVAAGLIESVETKRLSFPVSE
ncbi:MAG: hypothetical protein K0U72_00080 [Gammaproteobacteria bacterium]|nr:hypothetical protein [Gammaproteobacteria bacterium]